VLLLRIRQWFHRPAIRMGPIDNSRIHTTRIKNAQFVSYLTETGFRQVNADRYESSLHRRRLVKRVLVVLLIGGGAWVVIESARALSMP
jgi:hypothetical protein